MSVKLKKFRRKFTKEFKEEAVNLVVQEGLTQAKVCSDLGMNSAAAWSLDIAVKSRWAVRFSR